MSGNSLPNAYASIFISVLAAGLEGRSDQSCPRDDTDRLRLPPRGEGRIGEQLQPDREGAGADFGDPPSLLRTFPENQVLARNDVDLVLVRRCTISRAYVRVPHNLETTEAGHHRVVLRARRLRQRSKLEERER
jgi:hypothetical protein